MPRTSPRKRARPAAKKRRRRARGRRLRKALWRHRGRWPAVAGFVLGAVVLLAAATCRTAPVPVASTWPAAPQGDSILVAGVPFQTARARVLTWRDPGGYDAYDEAPAPSTTGQGVTRTGGKRFHPLRRNLDAATADLVARGAATPEMLAPFIDQVVIHYDAAGTSARCFDVLHHQRGLSSHFLLDLDGTIYQTLDVVERAWHAGVANDRSIGIEIAHIGARADPAELAATYRPDSAGAPIIVVAGQATGHRPARAALVHGRINGRDLVQYDYTDAQYRALVDLVATLRRALPGITLDVPRDADGAVGASALDPQVVASWRGLLGHHHITTEKIDPGPAFDWPRFLDGLADHAAHFK